eukprot:SAG11_NODE_15931_length_562_cov_0.876890_1_plen_35_part_10
MISGSMFNCRALILNAIRWISLGTSNVSPIIAIFQ